MTTVLCVQYTMQCHSSPQLVEVAGYNVWVMEETDGPCSDRPQTGHLRQKVHAQQHPLHSSPASSLARNTEPPRVTGTYRNIDSVCVIERGMPHAQLTVWCNKDLVMHAVTSSSDIWTWSILLLLLGTSLFCSHLMCCMMCSFAVLSLCV